MRDTDVLEGDVELLRAAEEVGPDAVADGFTLGDEFGGVELGDDGFEDFVSDGGQDALVVVLAEVLGGVSVDVVEAALTLPPPEPEAPGQLPGAAAAG